jgi:hypothetical protein
MFIAILFVAQLFSGRSVASDASLGDAHWQINLYFEEQNPAIGHSSAVVIRVHNGTDGRVRMLPVVAVRLPKQSATKTTTHPSDTPKGAHADHPQPLPLLHLILQLEGANADMPEPLSLTDLKYSLDPLEPRQARFFSSSIPGLAQGRYKIRAILYEGDREIASSRAHNVEVVSGK